MTDSRVLREYIRTLLREYQARPSLTRPEYIGSGPQPRNYIEPGGAQLAPSGWSHLEEKTPQAACCLIRRKDGKILAVSRRDNPDSWSLPGGKVDEGETVENAASRELEEETGLTATALKPVFTWKPPDEDYETTCFLCDAHGEIDTEESGVVRWVSPIVLVDPERCPFAAYNTELLRRL